MIQLENVSKVYPGNCTVLNGVNLEIHKGEIFGIVGKSGAGKSTLLRTLNWLAPPTSGEIKIEGQPLSKLSPSALRKTRQQIGMIFQHFNLLESRTVFENIALPLEIAHTPKTHIRQKVNELLEFVELTSFKNQYPHQLSGGQKQRVAIARALATNPKILLCDEATSALDPETTQNILLLLKAINAKLSLTIVLITHEMDVVKQICDRVGVIADGQIIETGPVLEVFTSPQAPETKKLVQRNLHLELPEHFAKNLKATAAENYYPVVRLAFIGHAAEEPITTLLYEKFKVTVNILLADLEWLNNAPIGFMICQLKADTANLNQALAFLNSLQIKTEVIGYAA